MLQENEVCRKSYFMVNGIARKFFILDNKEVTTEFFFEEDIAVSFESLVNQKPSKEVIECLTDVTVEAVDYNAFYQIRGQYPQLMEYVILVTELYVIWLEDRIFDFHARSATDRYLNLLKNIRNISIISSLPIFHLIWGFLWKLLVGSERKYKIRWIPYKTT